MTLEPRGPQASSTTRRSAARVQQRDRENKDNEWRHNDEQYETKKIVQTASPLRLSTSVLGHRAPPSDVSILGRRTLGITRRRPMIVGFIGLADRDLNADFRRGESD